VQVPVLALWGQDWLSPKALLDTVGFSGSPYPVFYSDPKKLLMLIVILTFNE